MGSSIHDSIARDPFHAKVTTPIGKVVSSNHLHRADDDDQEFFDSTEDRSSPLETTIGIPRRGDSARGISSKDQRTRLAIRRNRWEMALYCDREGLSSAAVATLVFLP